jgi:hypothetical protein
MHERKVSSRPPRGAVLVGAVPVAVVDVLLAVVEEPGLGAAVVARGEDE